MTYKELIQKYNQSEKAKEIIYLLSNKVKNLNKYVEFKNCPIDFELNKFEEIIKSKKPIERIIQKTLFCGREFVVLNNVFIPRYETELLVNVVCEKIKNLKNEKCIDLCSGTGAIGISLILKNPQLNWTLLDISKECTKNIEINLKIQKTIANVINDDWLTHLKNNLNTYSIITVNFPYVGINDEIDKNLIENDPRLALFSNENGWIHYKELLKWISECKTWKIIALECNSLHEKKWIKIQKEKKYKLKLIYDWNNLLRIVIIERFSKNTFY